MNRNDKIYSAMLIFLALAYHSNMALSQEVPGKTYGTIVDSQGNIRLPDNYRQTWTHLGSWLVGDPNAPGHGFHDVYTQKDAATAYLETGEFPDGSVLIKEVRAVESGAKTTGQAKWAGDTNIWFVMVKDQQERFKGNVHWGEGWGWALFKADNPSANVSQGFAETCLGCHGPAKNTDWVFIEGYPTLQH